MREWVVMEVWVWDTFGRGKGIGWDSGGGGHSQL